MMRVITGLARGRKLKTLEGMDVRPTTERVKEAMFSAIQFDIEGRKVLDLFAGSGQLGIEALSRGAALAVFVDESRDAVAIVKENLHTAGLEANARVINSDAFAYLAGRGEQFDIAFLDPPYRPGRLMEILPRLRERMTPHGVVLCEHAADEALPQSPRGFEKQKDYRYGKIAVTIYRCRPDKD